MLSALLLASVCTAQYAGWENEMEISAREAFFYGARAYPYGRVPQNARQDAILHAQEKMRPFRGGRAFQSADMWKPIGPYDLGGRITAVAVHPGDGSTLWAGAADGGVWKSTDRGASWTPTMDFENAIAVGALAVDPGDPNVVYAGTGETAMNVDTYGGAGIFKSTDAGGSWHTSGLTNVAAFSRIVVLPGSSGVVLAGAVRNNAGLYRSTDAGHSWERVLGMPVTDITINPSNADQVWVGGPSFGVMRSADAGRTFVQSGTGIAPDGAFIGRVSVQIAPSAPSTLYVLASEFSPQQGNLSRIYKSTNGGRNWTNVLDTDPDLLNYYGHPQGEYDNVLAVKPDDPNVVIAGGVIMVRSTDGGANWQLIETPLHPDHHALAFDPKNPALLYIGNDGGMYASPDAGTTFNRISKGLAITQFYAMAIDQNKPGLVYGGTQDNGTVTNAAADYWEHGPGVILGGDGFHVIVDPASPAIVYGEQPYGQMFRTDVAAGTRQQFTTGIDLTDPSDPAAWSAPMLLDPGDPTRFYCGRTHVYTRTAASSWEPISPPFRTPVSAIAVSPVDRGVIYAGSGLAAGTTVYLSDGIPLGEVKVTLDTGRTWVDRTVGSGLPDRVITQIVASPSERCTAYATFSGFYSGHVFRTTDCGSSWSDISAGLPDIPANALAIDPVNERTLYVGTDIGVFVSTDDGANWYTFGTGLPKAAVADMAVYKAGGMLRVATHGRSMWEIPLAGAAASPSVTVPAGREIWMGRTVHDIRWNGLTGPLTLEYSLDGGTAWQEIAAGISGSLYRWRVPDTVRSSVVTVRVRESAGQSDSARSALFTLMPYAPGTFISGSLQARPCWGLAFDGEHLWATLENSDTLLQLDRHTLAVLAQVKVGSDTARRRFTDITYAPGRRTFFLHDITDARQDGSGDAWLEEVTPGGQVLNRWRSPCAYPTGLAWLADSGRAGHLLASDLFGDQSFFVIDPESGSVERTIPRAVQVQFGPAGITPTADGSGFWQVIDDFDIATGPNGSRLVNFALGDQAMRCEFPLQITPDSAIAGGYTQWGHIFGRGVERDPEDGNLWVTNLDGAICKFTACEAVPSAVDDLSHRDMPRASLEPVIPNPARGEVRIRFTIGSAALVDVQLFDAAGRVAATLSRGEVDAGMHELPFDTSDLPAGIYRCRLRVNGAAVATATLVHVR
ncbi:MAG: hypothetical protein JST22_18605 [Bacteroidetes bacterium]|nr:hypothetical protein [Bacteroidota bacterium]